MKNSKGKQKELSPQDAALLIQMTFRAYLIRRSQALRGLRELAIAKAKLKKIRALFNNFSYRRHVARDAEERQRFSEKIIVLLLTVDAIEVINIFMKCYYTLILLHVNKCFSVAMVLKFLLNDFDNYSLALNTVRICLALLSQG